MKENLTKMFFILFELENFSKIIELYPKYPQVSRDPDIRIIYHISNAITNKSQESLEYLYNAKSTEHFINPKGFIPRILANNSVPSKYANIAEVGRYISPKYELISINSQKHDSEVELINRVNRAIGTPEFPDLVDLLADKEYAQKLKILHAINAPDIDYGLKASEYFIKNPNLQIIGLIISLIEGSQIQNPDSDISETQLYRDILGIVKGTLFELNLIYIRKWNMDNFEFLKLLGETIENLEISGHPKSLISQHLENIRNTSAAENAKEPKFAKN